MKEKTLAASSFSLLVAMTGGICAVIAAIYHAGKVAVKGVLSISGVFKGVKHAHKRIDCIENQIKELVDTISPMAPQISAIYDHLMNGEIEK